MAAVQNMESIPTGGENFVTRVASLPLIQDAYILVQSNSYSSLAFSKVEQISSSLLHLTQPIQARLPLATANVYANSALDFVEARAPIDIKTVKGEDLVKMARGPAEQAASIARAYTDQIQSRISPVTEQLSLRLQQSSQTIHVLQARLGGVAAALPRDKASATEAVNSLFREFDSLSAYIAEQRKNLPAHVQSTVQPILDRLQDSFQHIKDEASKPEVALSVKTTNILFYSKDQLSPLLNDAVGIVKTVIAAASTNATEAQEIANETAADAQDATVKEVKEVTKKTKRSAKVNGAAH